MFPPEGCSRSSSSQKTPKRGSKTSPRTPSGRVPVTPKATPKHGTPAARGIRSPQEEGGLCGKPSEKNDPEAWGTDFDDVLVEHSPQTSHGPNLQDSGQSRHLPVTPDITKTPHSNVSQSKHHDAGVSRSRNLSAGTNEQHNLAPPARNSIPSASSTPVSSRSSSSTLRPPSAQGASSRVSLSRSSTSVNSAAMSSNKATHNSSSENVPHASKRSNVSASSKGLPLCQDETKRACLMDISGQEANVIWNQKEGGYCNPAALAPSGHQEGEPIFSCSWLSMIILAY